MTVLRPWKVSKPLDWTSDPWCGFVSSLSHRLLPNSQHVLCFISRCRSGFVPGHQITHSQGIAITCPDATFSLSLLNWHERWGSLLAETHSYSHNDIYMKEQKNKRCTRTRVCVFFSFPISDCGLIYSNTHRQTRCCLWKHEDHAEEAAFTVWANGVELGKKEITSQVATPVQSPLTHRPTDGLVCISW